MKPNIGMLDKPATTVTVRGPARNARNWFAQLAGQPPKMTIAVNFDRLTDAIPVIPRHRLVDAQTGVVI
ncbi:MAG: hypothetical protein RLY66_305 [Candidatus Parcubacteria bacterium]|jgi:hypothetical protein